MTTTFEYFCAHAPQKPDWFKPVMRPQPAVCQTIEEYLCATHGLEGTDIREMDFEDLAIPVLSEEQARSIRDQVRGQVKPKNLTMEKWEAILYEYKQQKHPQQVWKWEVELQADIQWRLFWAKEITYRTGDIQGLDPARFYPDGDGQLEHDRPDFENNPHLPKQP